MRHVLKSGDAVSTPASSGTAARIHLSRVPQISSATGWRGMASGSSSREQDIMRASSHWLPTIFYDHYPPRAFIRSDKLLRGAHFEVQGVATRGAP